MKKVLLFLLLFFTSVFSQNLFSISGNIKNSQTNKSLPYANVKVLDQSLGTAANSEGEYKFNLPPGIYNLVYSYIGFTSDTVQVVLDKNTVIETELNPKDLQISEVTIKPGINPALAIIKNAIDKKNIRQAELESYVFHAYTKGVVRSDKDINAVTGGIEMDLFSSSEEDSTGLKIVGIIENQSKGYYKNPDYYKDEIIARKQTANFPASLNVITGGRIIQNFYDEELNVTGVNLPSPIADNALDYYYYYIEDSLAYDKKKVYQIYFSPDDANDPGFYGRVYITDGSYDLVKVNVKINSAANPGGIFKKLQLYQQFLSYKNIYMPVDYRLFGEIGFMGLINMSFEFNSILNKYEINKTINEDFFDMAIVKVAKDADDKDSLYWKNIQTVPTTSEERDTYQKMDSLMNVPFNFWEEFSPFAFNYNLGKNYTITAPLGMYNFNKVEGHSLNMEFSFSELLDQRFFGRTSLGYGFDDEKVKGKLWAKYLFGRLRTGEIELNIYNKLTDHFSESNEYTNFTSTVLSLFGKQDFRDYYYTKGFELKVKAEATDFLKLGVGFLSRTDNSAINNSDFSFFYKERDYTPNKPIFDARINAITTSFDIDFRKHIDDGMNKRKITQGKSLILFSGEAVFASETFGSDLNFSLFKFNTYFRIKSFGNTSFNINLDAIYSDKGVPYQMLYALPGTINNFTKPYTFRTLEIGEAVGDRIIAMNIVYNLQDDLFRAAGLTFLSQLDLTLTTHFNMAYVDVSDETKNLWYKSFNTYKTPLLEAGFSIGQKLFPISLDFTWRLNHRSKNAFVFGFSTPIL